MKKYKLLSKKGFDRLPLYSYDGSGEDLVRDVRNLPINATYITKDGMWTINASDVKK
jgi:hypothetical protein